jgi:hypothetical protein
LPSLLWNFTSCQDVPARSVAGFCGGACMRALQAKASRSTANHYDPAQVLFM